MGVSLSVFCNDHNQANIFLLAISLRRDILYSGEKHVALHSDKIWGWRRKDMKFF